VQGFKKYSTFNAVDGTDCVLWNGSEQDGNVRSEREKMYAPTAMMEIVRLSSTGRQKLMCCVYEINNKIFFLSSCFIFWGVARVILCSHKYSICVLFLLP
jgi:hypothetical protein